MSWREGLDQVDPGPLPPAGLPPQVQAFAFWTAVGLPAVYLPLLATGLNATWQQLLLIGLLVLNAVMIVLGHQYRTE